MFRRIRSQLEARVSGSSPQVAPAMPEQPRAHHYGNTEDSLFRQDSGNSFETSVKDKMDTHQRAIWLPSSPEIDSNTAATHLMALAAQACKEASIGAGAAVEPPATIFTETLRSLQGDFTCAEANLGASNEGLPLLVVAISEQVLSWKDYTKTFPLPRTANAPPANAQTSIGHFHPAVRQAAKTKLPVEQLAWLLRDQDCRVIICGHGIAGAVAQHAAMCVQQKLKSFDPEPDQPPPDAEVLVNGNEVLGGHVMADVLPAVMATIPANIDCIEQWLTAVTDVMDASSTDGVDAADEVKDSLHDLWVVGDLLPPAYMGKTWFLLDKAPPVQARKLQKFLRAFDARKFGRSPQLTYWQAARCVGDSLYTVPARDSSDLLKALRLGSSMGFFKPLTATGFGRAWYHRISTMPAPPMPMIGCHVTLEGPGIQWVCGQNMRVEMVGGGFENLGFELSQPVAACIAVQSGTKAEPPVNSTSQSAAAAQASQNDMQAPHSEYHITVHGNLVKTPGNLPVYPPEDASRVEVFLHLQTHFDKRRIKLRRDSHEEDVQGLKPKLTSGPLEDQLQRAIFKAACGLSSKNEEFQKIGRNVIDSIDVLEGWCRADAPDMSGIFARLLRRTYAGVKWDDKTIKEMVVTCSQVPGEAANGTANVYTELYEGELLAKWRANSKAIAAVLSTPLMIEYKKEPWEIALITVMIGLTVACTVIPLAQAALPAVGAVTGTMIALRCIPVLVTAGKLAYTWWGMMKLYMMAYHAKLQQLVRLLAPEQKSQNDIATLESIIYDVCNSALEPESPMSAFGEALRGPKPHMPPSDKCLPAPLPLWSKVELANRPDVRLFNKRRLAVGSLQALCIHVNQICAVVQLRQNILDTCLVGCIGEENAGKTTMFRGLQGLAPIRNAHEKKKATKCPAVVPLKVHVGTELKAMEGSPLLVDTPGMFDQRQELADCAIRHLGAMALTIIVMSPMKFGRIDVTMLNRIVEIVSTGKPTLVCFNQMSRYKDWLATDVHTSCKAAKADIEDTAQRTGTCGPVTVWATEFTEYDDDLEMKGCKCLEDVRDWVCHTAREAGFAVPENGLDLADLNKQLS